MTYPRPRQLTLYLALFAAGFFAVSWLRGVPHAPDDPAAEAVWNGGPELVLVLLVDVACGWSTDPALPQAWGRYLAAMQRALPRGIDRIHTIGVASGRSPQDGLALLNRIGTFDEIIAGGRWNAGSLRYMIGDLRGPVSTPQVVVARRILAPGSDGLIQRESEVVVQRITGLMAIERAAEQIPARAEIANARSGDRTVRERH